MTINGITPLPYREKPKYVEVVKFEGESNGMALARWTRGSYIYRFSAKDGTQTHSVAVPGELGLQSAEVGNYIVKHPDGMCSVMTPEELAEQYEPTTTLQIHGIGEPRVVAVTIRDQVNGHP